MLGYTESLHGKMVQNRDLGDQEVEYIYGMAFVENMMDIRKRPDFAKFRPHKTENLLLESVGSLEKLKAELEIRYKQKRTEKKEPKVEPLPKAPELNSLLPDRKGIKCEELMKILRVAKEPLAKLNQFILMIDIRPGDEFLDNRIKFEDSFARKYEKPKITHVDKLQPGAIASKLTLVSKSRGQVAKLSKF